MAYKALHFCHHTGCSELVTSSFCEQHQKEYDDKQAKIKSEYERTRASVTERGYDETWRRVRIAYLRKQPLCEICEKNGLTVPAVLVHHIRPISEGGARLDANNLMALCRECHEDIHKGDRFKKRGS
jgi:5-methylcytosine-specific restriction protein A